MPGMALDDWEGCTQPEAQHKEGLKLRMEQSLGEKKKTKPLANQSQFPPEGFEACGGYTEGGNHGINEAQTDTSSLFN